MAAKWALIREPGCLDLTVRGYMRGEEASAAVASFHDLAQGWDKFTFSMRLGEMTGYETEARVLWTEALLARRDQVELLRIQGVKNPMIRMALTGISHAVNLKFELVSP